MTEERYYSLSVEDRLEYLESMIGELIKLFWVSDKLKLASCPHRRRWTKEFTRSQEAYYIVRELREVLDGSSS